MLYSVSNWIYDFGKEPLTKTFDRLKRLGFDGVELIGEPEQYDAAEVRRLASDYGLRVLSVLGWCIAPTETRDLAHPDAKKRQAAVDYLKSGIDFAAAVGAGIVVVIPAPANRAAPVGEPTALADWQAAYDCEWNYALESVRAGAEYAQPRGITLAIEPINRYETFLVCTAEQGLRFVQQVGAPNVKMHLDTFHMNIEERDLGDAARLAGNLLVNVHVADSNRQAAGYGHTDFRGFVHALKEINYQGPLTLEGVAPGPAPAIGLQVQEYRAQWDRYAGDAINYLKELERTA